MALVKCNECGNMVSEYAVACPMCGNPVGKNPICPSCGKELMYCPSCKQRVFPPYIDEIDEIEETDDNTNNVFGRLGMMFGLIGLLMLLLFTLFAYNGSPKDGGLFIAFGMPAFIMCPIFSICGMFREPKRNALIGCILCGILIIFAIILFIIFR